ncbi:hypothetical protein N7470_003922 [Penicillium chermesinum]|nr:hypothetical protein N7470_003922 [Penicillium chermesinum]
MWLIGHFPTGTPNKVRQEKDSVAGGSQEPWWLSKPWNFGTESGWGQIDVKRRSPRHNPKVQEIPEIVQYFVPPEPRTPKNLPAGQLTLIALDLDRNSQIY